MIIGNNSFKKANGFINKNKSNYNQPQTNMKQRNQMISNNQNIMQHSNVLSKEDMNNRAFYMLNERLKNGTITMDEFNKQCKKLGKNSK